MYASSKSFSLRIGTAFPFANSQIKYLNRSNPISISIPAIKVFSKIIDLKLDRKGALQVPVSGEVAGWYEDAPSPGEIGPAIIVGHVDMNGKKGVFFDLKNLVKGDLIKIARGDGTVATFIVESTKTFLKSNFPTELTYGNIDHAGLRLITCGGKFDSKSGHYLSNIIVFAKGVNA